MSWIKMRMKYSGVCIVCRKTVGANETGFWARGIGVKHEQCAEVKGLKCIVCGGPAGCDTCELRDDCNLNLVSEACICRKCAGEPDTFEAYRRAAAKKFPALNPLFS